MAPGWLRSSYGDTDAWPSWICHQGSTKLFNLLLFNSSTPATGPVLSISISAIDILFFVATDISLGWETRWVESCGTAEETEGSGAVPLWQCASAYAHQPRDLIGPLVMRLGPAPEEKHLAWRGQSPKVAPGTTPWHMAEPRPLGPKRQCSSVFRGHLPVPPRMNVRTGKSPSDLFVSCAPCMDEDTWKSDVSPSSWSSL